MFPFPRFTHLLAFYIICLLFSVSIYTHTNTHTHTHTHTHIYIIYIHAHTHFPESFEECFIYHGFLPLSTSVFPKYSDVFIQPQYNYCINLKSLNMTITTHENILIEFIIHTLVLSENTIIFFIEFFFPIQDPI